MIMIKQILLIPIILLCACTKTDHIITEQIHQIRVEKYIHVDSSLMNWEKIKEFTDSVLINTTIDEINNSKEIEINKFAKYAVSKFMIYLNDTTVLDFLENKIEFVFNRRRFQLDDTLSILKGL